jgi:AraC family transcriptional regulator
VVYRDNDGHPVLHLTPRWRGIPLNLYRSQIRAERGPCHVDHPVLIFCHNIDGRRWHRQNGKNVELMIAPGMVELLGLDYQREWARWDATPGFNVGLQLTPQTVKRLAPELPDFDITTTHELFDPKLQWLIRELHDEAQSGAQEGGLYAESLSCALIARLAKNHGTRKSEAFPVGGLSASCRCRTIDFIEAHLGDEISITALAKEAGLSPNHFSNCFTVSFGLPPHRYLQQRRVEEALIMLTNSSRSVADIAMDLGFSSQSHFTKIFRRLTGVTPTIARRS